MAESRSPRGGVSVRVALLVLAFFLAIAGSVADAAGNRPVAYGLFFLASVCLAALAVRLRRRTSGSEDR